jgi:hypothetical protein
VRREPREGPVLLLNLSGPQNVEVRSRDVPHTAEERTELR